MKKFVYIGNILSTLPAFIVVPLVPFIFILIVGEGRIPGYFHEYSLRALMVIYPLTLVACLSGSLWLLRRGKERRAASVSLLPLAIFGLLLLTYLQGGVVLR